MESMIDRQALNQQETDARRKLTASAQAMLEGKLSFLEGAIILRALQDEVGGVASTDIDFNFFTAIASETDHLPRPQQYALWNAESLLKLMPEIKNKEDWASSFAAQACRNLIDRFR